MTTPAVLGSVVIPAHNEAAVIRGCLDSLLAGFLPGELEVIVACNGCTDDTARIVRSSGHPVRVIEIAEASKPAALRAADELAVAFPRIYLDADVVLGAESARRVLERLGNGTVLAARPPLEYDSARSSALVRSYYRARAEVPAVMGSLWGAGVYGLSKTGRERFDGYPDVIADDLFVDQHFEASEIEIVSTDAVVVRVPRRTADLLRILRRTYQGNREHKAASADPGARSSTTSAAVRDLARLARTRPAKAADAVIYLALAAFARLTLAIVPAARWERDNSSRAT